MLYIIICIGNFVNTSSVKDNFEKFVFYNLFSTGSICSSYNTFLLLVDN